MRLGQAPSGTWATELLWAAFAVQPWSWRRVRCPVPVLAPCCMGHVSELLWAGLA